MISLSALIEKANTWLQGRHPKGKMVILPDSVLEHEHSYSFFWCLKEEEHLDPSQRSMWGGIGRVFISKDGNLVNCGGSAPIDWVNHFELQVLGLEEHWHLSILYQKQHLSTLKFALKCSTSELLQLINENQRIICEEPKGIFDYEPSFQEMVDDLKAAGVVCNLEVRRRSVP